MGKKTVLLLPSILVTSLFLCACSNSDNDVTETNSPKINQENISTEESLISKKELDTLTSAYATSTQTDKPTKKEIEQAIDQIEKTNSKELADEGISKNEQKEIAIQYENAYKNLNTYNIEQLAKDLKLTINTEAKDSNASKLSTLLDAYTTALDVNDLKGTLKVKKFEKDLNGLYQEKPKNYGYIFTVERYGTTATYHFNKDKNGDIYEIFITYPAVDNKETSDKFIKNNFGLSYTGKSKNLQTYYDLETGDVSSIVFKGVPNTRNDRVVIVTNTTKDDMYYTEEVIMRN